MMPLSALMDEMMRQRGRGEPPFTLLAVCPNSLAVMEAGVRAAASEEAPMLFAATLNQVDRDGGYTGWTPGQFVDELRRIAASQGWDGPLYPCLDHGGPWLKDRHTTDQLTLEQTMEEVRLSLAACLEAGYELLHIDPTVDRTLGVSPIPIDLVVDRTLDLISYAEETRSRLGLPQVCYEVGTEEVHGGLADTASFEHFLASLRQGLSDRDLLHAWPRFVVGKVGTDLHTTFFDPDTARYLSQAAAGHGSFVKGHYTDWVDSPELYPATGMGGANVGPEFTAAEYAALAELCRREQLAQPSAEGRPSDFMAALEEAVMRSGRWRKWLQPEEAGRAFGELAADRREWLVQTGARYVWTEPSVAEARSRLYRAVQPALPDPHEYVVERITVAIVRYLRAFRLGGTARRLAAR